MLLWLLGASVLVVSLLSSFERSLKLRGKRGVQSALRSELLKSTWGVPSTESSQYRSQCAILPFIGTSETGVPISGNPRKVISKT